MHHLSIFLIAALVSATAAGQTSLAADIVRVEITGLAFSPGVVVVRPGDTIEWVNHDFIDHTATAEEREGAFDVVIQAGKSARLTFSASGSKSYYCRYHPAMKGRITISQPAN